jgi:hypothetical protein
MVVYHGTQADITAFSTDAERVNRVKTQMVLFYFRSRGSKLLRRKALCKCPKPRVYSGCRERKCYACVFALTNPFNHGGTNSKFPETPVTQNMLKQFEKELRKENPDLDSSWYQEKT